MASIDVTSNKTFSQQVSRRTVLETNYTNDSMKDFTTTRGSSQYKFLDTPDWDRNRSTLPSGSDYSRLKGSGSEVLFHECGDYGERKFTGSFSERSAPPHGSRFIRLREALFPEGNSREGKSATLPLGSLSPTIGQPGLTSVQHLAAPAQGFKHVTINLINYQEDCDAAVASAPKLAILLDNSSDPAAQRKALLFICQLAKKHASRYGLASSEELIRSLLRLLEKYPSSDILQILLCVLYHLSLCPQGAEALVRFLTIPMLVRLLSHEVPEVANYALSILHSVMQLIEASKPIVRQCEGVQRLCELLVHIDARVLTLVVDSLHLLAFSHPETKLVLLSMGAPQELVRILMTYRYEKLLFVTTRLLRVLSVCSENKPVIIKVGGVQALAPLLEANFPPHLMLASLWTLRNLSDQAFALTSVDAMLERLATLLVDSNDNVSTCACGCLCNFTCQNDHNKTVLVKCGAVELFCRALTANMQRDEVTEPLCCAMRHLTHRHPLATVAQQQCLQYQGVQNVARILLRMHQLIIDSETASSVGERFSITGTLQGFSWPLLKALLGVVRNMALHEASRAVLRDLGVVSVICQALLRSYTGAQAIARQRGSVLSIQSELSFVEGVRLEDMCELALTGLHAFTADAQCRHTILYTPEVLPITVQILYHTSEYLQRASTSVLCELARDAHGIKLIEQEGATSRLTQLLHSQDAAVAAFSATCLYRLAGDKSPEYRARMAEELQQSLMDAGIVRPEDVHLTTTGEVRHSAEVNDHRDLDYPINFGVLPAGNSATLGNGSAGHVNEAFQDSYDDMEGFASVRTKRHLQKRQLIAE